jgi:hypothetical protein
MNLQEQISRIQEMMGMDNSRLTFDIQKLVDQVMDKEELQNQIGKVIVVSLH